MDKPVGLEEHMELSTLVVPLTVIWYVPEPEWEPLLLSLSLVILYLG
jgi:hypothetical protein